MGAMRRLLVILMILLLHVHTWAGQRMAVGMAQQELAAAVAAQAGDTAQADADAAMPADCPMMLAKATSGQAGQPHGMGCQACQLCMAMAAMPLPPAQASVLLAPAPPVLDATPFASAELVRLAEPPIR